MCMCTCVWEVGGLLNNYEVKRRRKVEGGEFGPSEECEAAEIHLRQRDRGEDTDKQAYGKKTQTESERDLEQDG